MLWKYVFRQSDCDYNSWRNRRPWRIVTAKNNNKPFFSKCRSFIEFAQYYGFPVHKKFTVLSEITSVRWKKFKWKILWKYDFLTTPVEGIENHDGLQSQILIKIVKKKILRIVVPYHLPHIMNFWIFCAKSERINILEDTEDTYAV